MNNTGPQYDPQPGDTMTYHQNGVAHNVRTVTAVDDRDVHFDMRWARGGSTNVDYGRSMSRETWALDDDGTYTYARPEAPAAPEAPAPAPKAEGPRFDPQPGDTMTFHYCDGPANVRTVTARDGDNIDFEVRWVRNNDRTYLGSMDLEDWQDDGGGDYTYARPEAPKARTAEDAYNDPQPGDTLTSRESGIVYTVTSRDGAYLDTTYVEHNGRTGKFAGLSLGWWGTAFPERWVYAPGVPAPTPAQAAPADDTADRLAQALADLDAARADARDARDALAAAEKAVALAERVAGALAASEAFATTAALYLTACRAVMSPAQVAVVEILVGLAPRA